MALEIKNAPGRPGYAHLTFNRDIDAGSLRISVFNLMKREYLGHSVAKVNWTPSRSHFFTAILVERKLDRTTFVIGPEVTTFIPDETTVEVISEDLAVRETTVWSGILLGFHWKGPDTEADEQEAKRRAEEDARKQAEARRLEEEARKAAEAEARKQAEARRLEEEVKKADETDAKRREAERTGTEQRSYTKPLAAIAVVVMLAGALFSSTQNWDFLCDKLGVLCTTETLAYRKATECAKPISCGAMLCIAEYRRSYPNGRFKVELDQLAAAKPRCANPELEAVGRAEACARPLSCGAEAACLTDYRRAYPNGGLKARIDRLAVDKPPCRDLDSEAFRMAEQCAMPLTCGANSCLTEYRRYFPNGRYKAQADRIGVEKGIPCPVDTLPPFNPRPSGQDAGINCEQLSNPVPIEEMICADADIARANADLQRTWERLSPAQRQRLRQAQRDWITRRDSECNVPRSGGWDQMVLRRLKTCVIDKIRVRSNELQ